MNTGKYPLQTLHHAYDALKQRPGFYADAGDRRAARVLLKAFIETWNEILLEMVTIKDTRKHEDVES